MLVPTETPITNPELVTVATIGEDDIHGLETAGVPEPVNCVVNPTQTFVVPVIVGAQRAQVMVCTNELLSLPQAST